MNQRLYWFLNSLILFVPLLMDRISKQIVVSRTITYQEISNYLYFDLTYNRGISWGIFNTENSIVFVLVSLIVTAITLFLVWMTWEKIKSNQLVIGEILVISGSISNIIDRIVYHGVVDFIVIDYKGWSWPAFNIADSCIVIGATIMLFTVRPDGAHIVRELRDTNR